MEKTPRTPTEPISLPPVPPPHRAPAAGSQASEGSVPTAGEGAGSSPGDQDRTGGGAATRSRSALPLGVGAGPGGGRSMLGPDRAALVEATGLADAHREAVKAVAPFERALGEGLARLRGAPPAQQQAFIEAFRAQHAAEYRALEAARTRLMQRLSDLPEEAVVDLFRGEHPAQGVDVPALAGALALATDTPEGLALARRVARALTAELASLDALTPAARLARLDQLGPAVAAFAREVLPGLIQAEVGEQARALDDPGEALSRARALFDGLAGTAGTRLMQALGNLDLQAGAGFAPGSGAAALLEVQGTLGRVRKVYDGMKDAIGRGDVQAAAGHLAELPKIGALGSAFASVGIIGAAMAFARGDGVEGDWQALSRAVIGLGNDAAGTIGALMKHLGGAPGAGKLLGPLTGVVGGVLGIWGGVSKVIDGEAVEGGLAIGAGTLSVLAALNLVPGGQAFAAAAGLILLGVGAFQDKMEDTRRDQEINLALREAGFSPAVVRFLAAREPGTLEALTRAGLSVAEVEALLAEQPGWADGLGALARGDALRKLGPLRWPGESLPALLRRVGEGLSPEEFDAMAQHLAVARPDPASPGHWVFPGLAGHAKGAGPERARRLLGAG